MIRIRIITIVGVGVAAAFGQNSPPLSHVDVVLFGNGDRLTGELVSVSSKGIAFTNEAVGTLTLPWSRVKQVRSPERYQALVGTKSPNKAQFSKFTEATIEMPSEGVLAMKVDQKDAELIAEDQTAIFSDIGSSPTPAPAKPSGVSWTAGINSGQPTSVSWGTTSQRTLGGTATLAVTEGSWMRPIWDSREIIRGPQSWASLRFLSTSSTGSCSRHIICPPAGESMA